MRPTFGVKRPAVKFPRRTVDGVLGLLAGAFDGYEIAGQEALRPGAETATRRPLRSSDKIAVDDAVSDQAVPYLAWHLADRPLAIATAGWERWSQVFRVDAPARLKIHVDRPRNGARQIRQAIDSVASIVKSIAGLPVALDGRLVPYSRETGRLIDAGKVEEWVDRDGGPHLTAAVVREIPGAPYATIDFTFHLEFTADYDERDLGIVKVIQVGVTPNTSQQWEPGDVTLDLDYAARTGFDSPDPALVELGSPHEIAFPPLVKTSHVEGADPFGVVVSVVLPPSLAVAALATSQLLAIVNYLDGHAEELTAGPVWATGNAAVATVSQAGLVTGVGAGSTTITAQHLGVSSNACTVTVA